MSYQALARKYRPQTFEDLLGQDSIVQTLQNSIRDSRIHQAYLFSGVRGVGKTTTARIFAKALNCVKGPTVTPCNECSICREITEGIDLDVREIDAATYSKADDVREIREVNQFQPARDRYRIFIIDEVHSISAQAWNALLKQIEEPPPHAVFMMATTEMHKVPPTILSRVQQFVFRTVTTSELAGRLASVCESEGIAATGEALEIIARRGDGSVRDALSLLDQIVAFSGRSLSAEDVATVLGLSDSSFFLSLVQSVHAGNPGAVMETLDEAARSGRDFKLLYRDLLRFFRNMMLIASGASDSLLKLESDETESVREASSLFEPSQILRIMNVLIQDDELIQRSEQQRLAVEIAVLKAATLPRLRAVEEFLSSPEKISAVSGYTSRSTQRKETPRSSPGQEASSDSDDLKMRITADVGSERKMTASYVSLAKTVSAGAETVRFTFQESDRFVAEQLSEPDQTELIRNVAQRILGRPVGVLFEVLGQPVRSEAQVKRSAIDEDPVIQSFAKHLGGEVVRNGK